MISNRALTALAIAAACVILTPRVSGRETSNGGFTNPFVSAIFGMIHPGGGCVTNAFVGSLCISSDACKSCPLNAGQGVS